MKHELIITIKGPQTEELEKRLREDLAELKFDFKDRFRRTINRTQQTTLFFGHTGSPAVWNRKVK